MEVFPASEAMRAEPGTVKGRRKGEIWGGGREEGCRYEEGVSGHGLSGA